MRKALKTPKGFKTLSGLLKYKMLFTLFITEGAKVITNGGLSKMLFWGPV
jgi:hypothetical protein